MPRPRKLTKKSKQRLNRLKKNAKRLAAYSAAAAATVLTTQDRSATADEVIWDNPDAVITSSQSLNGIWFNVVNGSNTASASANPGFVPTPATSMVNGPGRVRVALFGSYAHPYLLMQSSDANKGFVGGANFDMLVAGDPIGAAQTFGIGAASGSVPSSNWARPLGATWGTDGHGYTGLRFSIGADTHYGWVEITRYPGDTKGLTIHAFGYNNTAGEQSFAGGAAVPEPSSMLLLAAGAAGFGAFRRRRESVKAA